MLLDLFPTVFDMYPEIKTKRLYNVFENENKDTVIELSIPGFSKEDLEVYMEEGYLIVKGQKQETKGKRIYTHKELFVPNHILEKFWLSQSLEPFEINLSNGILSITCRKNNPDRKLLTIQ